VIEAIVLHAKRLTEHILKIFTMGYHFSNIEKGWESKEELSNAHGFLGPSVLPQA
jgi:hypothetical protein